MVLRSDYSEAYDALLPELPGKDVFERMAFTKGGLSKRETFAFFERLGIATPPHGLVRNLKQQLQGRFLLKEVLDCHDPEVVVYFDEYAHCGTGKELVPLSQAPDQLYASLYFPTSRHGASTYRKIRFGHLEYWRHNTSSDWRSNIDCQRVVIRRTCHLPLDTPIPRILWAIDYIPTPLGLLAIDFNTAPSFELLDAEFPDDKYEYVKILRACANEHPEWLKQP